MERPVISKDVLLLLGDVPTSGEPTYETVICATTMTLNRTSNISKTETKCGVIKTPGSHDYSVNFSGVVMLEPDAGHMSEAEISEIFKADRMQAFKIGKQTPTKGDVVYSGKGYISTENTTWPATGESTFEVTIEAVDEILQTITP